jgi:limonene 1,2-monooxygenase
VQRWLHMQRELKRASGHLNFRGRIPVRQIKLRLGLFVAPFHGVNESPTLCYERDLELARYADELGIAELWYGEHHSGGYEIICSPELMVAAAAQRTKRIRLGTGVVSLPYHNPLNTANRIAQLDHLTRGRLMFGAGPGLLSADAHMLALDAGASREKLDQGLDVITRLLRGDWVTEETNWYKLQDAHCQVLPCGEPLEIAIASAMSPSGAVVAAKYGAGMLCLASTLFGGFNALTANWQLAQQTAIRLGRTMNIASLRCATDIHIAETREQAFAQVREGYENVQRYFRNQSGHVPDSPANISIEELVERGEATVGTPEDAIATIRRLESQVPDFGCLLLFDKNWARLEHKQRSLELMMRYVLPAINGDNENRVRSFEWQTTRREQFFATMMDATKRAFDKYESDAARERQ